MKVDKVVAGGLASVAALAAGSQLANAQDFTGAYAGISANTNRGDFPWGDEDYKIVSDLGAGAFVGTRWQSGNAVLGVELAYQGDIGGDANEDSGSPEEYGFTNLVDMKFSVGTPVGKTLLYGFAGLSAGHVVANSDSQNYNAVGANFGVGADYSLSETFSVGAEYTQRIMDGYDNAINDKVGTFALRASFHF